MPAAGHGDVGDGPHDSPHDGEGFVADLSRNQDAIDTAPTPVVSDADLNGDTEAEAGPELDAGPEVSRFAAFAHHPDHSDQPDHPDHDVEPDHADHADGDDHAAFVDHAEHAAPEANADSGVDDGEEPHTTSAGSRWRRLPPR